MNDSTELKEQNLNRDDLIINIDEQIEYLISKGLKVNNRDELKHIIINYGFNSLFRKYSSPFIENRDNKWCYKENTTEISILKLYYFDYSLTNIIINFVGSFELKLTSNIIEQLNFECPDYEKQLNYLWKKEEYQKKLIRPIIRAGENGSDYLKPFIENNIYPGWTILGEMTLGQKLEVFSILKTHDRILKDFYLSDFNKEEFYCIVFDFIRPLRNVAAHFDRLFKYHIVLNEKQSDLFKRFMNLFVTNEEYRKEIIDKGGQKLESFDLIIMLIYLLGNYRATIFVDSLKKFVEQNKPENNKYFDVDKFLTDSVIYNWPKNWLQILEHILENKINLKK